MSRAGGFNPTVMPFEDKVTNIDGSLLPKDAIVFTNCRLCICGQLTQSNSVLIASASTGKTLDVIWKKPAQVSGSGNARIIDLGNKILAPGFLELQTNGMRGVHFTRFENEEKYEQNLEEVANYLPSQGVTGFWATVPTVKAEEFKTVCRSCYVMLTLHLLTVGLARRSYPTYTRETTTREQHYWALTPRDHTYILPRKEHTMQICFTSHESHHFEVSTEV